MSILEILRDTSQNSADKINALTQALEQETELNLSWSNLTPAEITLLCKALEDNHTVTSLNLTFNTVGDEGAQALAKTLKVNQTLTHLEMLSAKITTVGAQDLAKALELNRVLLSLNIGNNLIGKDGAKAIAEALKGNHSLIELSLKGNCISNDGVQAIAEALKVTHTLTSLDLSDYRLEFDLSPILNALKFNESLIKLKLMDNIFSSNLKNIFHTVLINRFLKRNKEKIPLLKKQELGNVLNSMPEVLTDLMAEYAAVPLIRGKPKAKSTINKAKTFIRRLWKRFVDFINHHIVKVFKKKVHLDEKQQDVEVPSSKGVPTRLSTNQSPISFSENSVEYQKLPFKNTEESLPKFKPS